LPNRFRPLFWRAEWVCVYRTWNETHSTPSAHADLYYYCLDFCARCEDFLGSFRRQFIGVGIAGCQKRENLGACFGTDLVAMGSWDLLEKPMSAQEAK